jgi:hypothetical protein
LLQVVAPLYKECRVLAMSKLKELVNRGVRLIVADTPEHPTQATAERDLPPEAFAEAESKPVGKSAVAADVEDFAAVYEEARIELPLHGYGVDKVAEMLQSKRLESLGRDVRATAVMAALEAAQVPVKDVLQDAVLRDRALDAFELAKEREVKELRAEAERRIHAIKDEIEAFLKAKNAELESLKKAGEGAQEAFVKLQARKRREEERLYDVAAHFVEGAPNPITTSASTSTNASSPPPPPRSDKA